MCRRNLDRGLWIPIQLCVSVRIGAIDGIDGGSEMGWKRRRDILRARKRSSERIAIALTSRTETGVR